MICAEILSDEIQQYLNFLKDKSKTNNKSMKQIILKVDDVFRNIERKMDENLDHQ